VYSARDGQLVLDVFEFGERDRFDPEDPPQAERRARLLAHARETKGRSPEAFERHLRHCSADYVLTVTPFRFGRALELYDRVSGADGAEVVLEHERDRAYSRVVVAVGNATPRQLFERCATYLGHRHIDIERGYLDVFDDPGSGHVSMVSFVVRGPDGRPLDPDGALWTEVRRDLMRMKWLDERAYALALRHGDLGVQRAETVVALATLAHQLLARENPHAFARERIFLLLERHLAQATAVGDLFLQRFDPSRTDDPFAEASAAIRADIERSVDLEEARRVLGTMLDAAGATLRTNAYVERRYALALRIDPAFLHGSRTEEVPHGAFFVHGGSFDGFHVRFRDIARGGLRVVRPLGAEQHALEADRHYDECFGLAYAQQLKNKDIPEGGAKAVVLVTPEASIDRSVKAFTDALLDLLVHDEATKSNVRDRQGIDEILYLGPDENITPALIEWIVARAKRRSYRMPNAFMSSKPGAGINHKTYGVTSEGVAVFLEVALRSAGIDPRHDSFTLKITGGTDGDVGGNAIRILARDYGARAKIVGIADGSGALEDPDGLDNAELLRLVAKEAPCAEFDRGKLGARGRLTLLSDPGGLKARNTLHNRVRANAFLPAGGRPQTIHAGNWRQFLDDAGKPSSAVIVEGANLFLTPEARQHLSGAGAVIVKDSSANKCGVICSSFEIIACMLLSEAEFLAVKERFVGEVLARLRELARLEAELLFAEHRRRPQLSLPEMSTRLSKTMNRASDAVAERIARVTGDDATLAREIVLEHLPPILREVAGARVDERLPSAYRLRIIATHLASRIVYKEGLDYLDPLPDDAIGELAMRYLRQERQTARLVDEVRGSGLADRERIAVLLERGGTRAGLTRD
jgi:glutamate dehydrogenase